MLGNNRQAKLSFHELHQLKWLAGTVLTLLALWSLASLDFGGKLFVLPIMALVGANLLNPALLKRVPAALWRAMPWVILAIIVIDFVTSVPDSAFLEATIRMVILLLTYRCVFFRSRREDLQLVLLCLFSVMLSGVLTVSLLFAFQALLFTPVAMAMLFLISLLNTGKSHALAHDQWTDFSWRRFARRVWWALDFRALMMATALFALVTAMATAIFVLTPRYNFNSMLSFMELKTEPLTGFSEQVRLGEVTGIRQDDSVALRVDVPSFDAIQSTPYWRMLVLDGYADGVFSMSPSLKQKEVQSIDGVDEIAGWGLPPGYDREGIWNCFLEGGVSRFIPLPEAFGDLLFAETQDASVRREQFLLNLGATKSKVIGYQLRGVAWPKRLQASDDENEFFLSDAVRDGAFGTIDAEEFERYPLTTLNLPLNEADRAYLDNVMSALPEEAFTVQRFAFELTRYLRSRYSYSLSRDGDAGEGEDPVVAWMRTGSRGHCELFAGAFTLLARTAGYPTRMVVGFAGGSWNPVENYFVVRNSDAHAWVEIYDAANGTWLRVDPTPGEGRPSDPEMVVAATIPVEEGWDTWVDSLRMQWYRRVVSFDRADQQELVSGLFDGGKALAAAIKQVLTDWWNQLRGWFSTPWRGLPWLDFARILLVACLGILVWRRRHWIARMFKSVLNRPQGPDPIRSESGKLLIRFDGWAHRAGVKPTDWPAEWKRARASLESLRFGPISSRQESWLTLKAARRVFRRRRDWIKTA